MERAKLELRLLGPPDVLRDGTPLRLRTKKAFALLAYLAAEGGTHRRAELSSLLWPASDEKRARTTLRSALADLRSALGSGEEGQYLLAHRDAIGFGAGARAELDLTILKNAQDLVRNMAGVTRPDSQQRREVMDRLREGLEAYRGEFLEGFYLDDAPDFDDWASLEREAWRRRAEAIFDRLSQLQLGTGEVSQALTTAERWTQHARTSEAAYRRLMEASFAAGDRAAALRAYEACSQVLRNELGVEPSPETETLAAHIRVEVSSNLLALNERSSTSETTGLGRGRLKVPFVGRLEEFGLLIEAYYAASDGNPRAVVIAGEAGIGKTRFVEEFLSWAVAEGAEVLKGAAFEATEGLPYGPLVGALRSWVDRERARDNLLDVVWLSELSRLLPELKARYPDLPALATDETTAKARLFEAVAAFVAALARHKPIVLFIDDLQWADAATLDLLRYAARRWAEEGVPVLLVMAARLETPEAQAQFAERQAGFAHDLPLRREVLRPLTEKDTVRLVQTLTSQTSQAQGDDEEGRLERFGGWLHSETGGQPFYLTETLSALVERGVLFPSDEPGRGWVVGAEAGPGGIVPPSVREATLARLAGLGSDASLLLAAAAVLGRHAEFEDLRQVVGMGEDAGLSALEEALASGLLHEASVGGYGCAHDKIRDVTYTEVGGARRRVYHRRALEVLEGKGAPAAELARHALAAREDEAAFRHSVAAAEEALAVFAVEDARTHLGRARTLLGGEAPGGKTSQLGTPEERLRLYAGLGRVHEVAREWGEARDVYGRMLEEARRAGEREAEWSTLHRLATLGIEANAGQSWQEDEFYQSVRRKRDDGDKGDDGRGLRSPGDATPEDFAWSLSAARACSTEALGLAREMRREDLVAQSLATLGVLEAYSGRWERSLSAAEEGLSFYSRMGDRTMEGRMLNFSAWGLLMTGEPGEAIRRMRDYPGLTNELGDREIHRATVHGMVLALTETGDYEEALAIAREGLAAARSVGYAPRLMINLLVLGDALRALFCLREAEEVYREMAGVIFPPEYRALVHSKLCAVAALAADWTEAHTEALLAARLRDEAPVQSTGALHIHLEVEALLRGGSEHPAREQLERFGEAVGENRRLRLAYGRALAVLRRWEGDGAAALEHLQEARRLAGEIGLPGELWQLEASLGELFGEMGNETEARRSRSRAAETLRRLAGGIRDRELRQRFLSATPVRTILDSD